MDYTACKSVRRKVESSVRSVGSRGMRISNRGSDTEIFSDHKMSATAESGGI